MHVIASKIRYQGTRPSQQDAVSVFSVKNIGLEQVFVAGVLTDGIGGLSHGETASELVNAYCKSWLETNLTALETDGEIPALLARLPAAADLALAARQADEGLGDCGTTLIAAVIADQMLHFVSVGDSLIFTVASGDELKRLNVLHNTVVDGRSMLTAAILGQGVAAMNQGQAELGTTENPWILIASDGIRSLSGQEIVRSIEGGGKNPLRVMISAVKAKKLTRQDNMSMILFRALGSND